MQTETEFLRQTAERFRETFDHVLKAVGQLDDEQVWKRPSMESNSAGIVLQHLIGNLNQWMCAGIGGETYKRNRPAEFRDDHHPSSETILRSFQELGNQIQNILGAVPPESLHTPKTIQNMDGTVMSAIYKAITHCEFHAGQLLYIAKLMLNEKYKGVWGPPPANSQG